MNEMSHVDGEGKARMVDVGRKDATSRRAVARGRVLFGEEAFERLRENSLAKGDAIGVARLAGIQAAKRTSDLIPLCHPIPLEHVDVEIALVEEELAAVVTASAGARWSTGVEMEALVAAGAACLTLYDMAKGIDKGITITDLQLLEKSGGKSGDWKR